MRIDKLISNMGFCSRKEVKNYIKNKKITINNNLVNSPNTYVDVQNDIIYFCGKKVNYQKYIYLVMNKPSGYVCANIDNINKTVFDIISNEYNKKQLFVAGRLDKDTEGMLIITNNGKFAHNMLSPKKHVDKKYFVITKGGIITNDDIDLISKGVTIKVDNTDYKCKTANIDIVSNGFISECFITISEGKFHQVKKMFLAIGKEVTYLKRVQIGNFELDSSINIGEYRNISDYELELIGVDLY